MVGVKTFNIKGERCSGTNYLQKLVETNLNVKYEQQPNTGWKHGYYSLFAYQRDSPDTFLTIVIFRNPFDWLRSVYHTPHHIVGASGGCWISYLKPTFSEFIRNEVNQFHIDKILHRERHPLTFEKAKNFMELRKWKLQNFLNLKNILPNTYYTTYEELAQDPQKIISEINDRWFNIDFEFQNWTKYKKTDEEYTKKDYLTISDEDRSFIIENLDWDLESKFGYTPN